RTPPRCGPRNPPRRPLEGFRRPSPVSRLRCSWSFVPSVGSVLAVAGSGAWVSFPLFKDGLGGGVRGAKGVKTPETQGVKAPRSVIRPPSDSCRSLRGAGTYHVPAQRARAN